MAKRRTLRRQRDKALAELKRIKELRQLHTMSHWNVERRMVRVQGYHINTKYEMMVRPAKDIIRDILHDIVDEGLLDGLVYKYAEVDAYNTRVKHQIAMDVIAPESNYDDGYFSRIWADVEASKDYKRDKMID